MIIYLIVLVFFLILLFWIPQSWWEYLYDKSNQQFKIVLNFKEKGKQLSMVYAGENLLFKLSKYSSEISVGKIGSNIELHSYKFYTSLLEELFVYKRQFGIPLSKILISIRGGIKKDFQFEKKIQNELLGGMVQFIFISVITWFFSFMVSTLVHLESSFMVKFIIIFLQGLGIIVFWFLYKKHKKKQFRIFEVYYKVLFSLLSLMDVGLPASKILSKASVESLDEIHDSDFTIVKDKLKSLIESYKNSGHQIKNELESVIDEVYFLQEERFDQFLKFLEVLKFFILCLFFLSAYFIYLFTLFSSFLME